METLLAVRDVQHWHISAEMCSDTASVLGVGVIFAELVTDCWKFFGHFVALVGGLKVGL
jgi:hypothetical protein